MEQIPIDGLKVVGSQSAFGSIKYGLSRLGFYALLAMVILGVQNIITDSQAEASDKQAPVKAIIYGKNIMFGVVQVLLGADAKIYMNVEKLKAGDVVGTAKLITILSTVASVLFIYSVFFGLRIPIIGKEISLTDVVWDIVGRNVPSPNVYFLTALLFIAFAGWFGSANGVDNYIPFEGIVTFFTTFFSNPKLFFPLSWS